MGTPDMPCRIVVGGWNALANDARAIRHEVFVLEQQVPEELELDAMDAQCLHAVAYDLDGVAVATGRLLPDAHIGRMAVRETVRGSGVGGALLTKLIEVARQRGDSEVVLSAQVHAESFYRRHGFVREGAEYLDAGIVHVTMRRSLETIAK
ncbi:MAG: family acetyltransferase [Herbaspirillum sp.]|jgi:predicted GNAT family N-acyltransferase|nr:family acetyltransferase [Herbaspirillum sp.]